MKAGPGRAACFAGRLIAALLIVLSSACDNEGPDRATSGAPAVPKTVVTQEPEPVPEPPDAGGVDECGNPARMAQDVTAAAAPALDTALTNLETELRELLGATDYAARLEELATSAAACAAGRLLMADMQQPALYASVQGACTPVDPAGPEHAQYFSDPACAHELAFRPTSYSEYCDEMVSAGPNARLGNAAAWSADAAQANDPLPAVPSRKWTVAQGAQLALSSEPLDGKTAPFMKRLRYRELAAFEARPPQAPACADGADGGSRVSLEPADSCELELRVYKKDAAASGLIPLLAFHGGGWRYRGGAFVGFEAQLAHYTEEGFVVFAPFYRLSGDADGNAACNDAPWEAITADAEAALSWVRRHGAAFGAKPVPPAVMGQSAGAHLAGWLLAHRPQDVAAGLLLYGPTDVRDFLAQAVPAGGLYHDRFAASLKVLSRFFGSDVRTLDLGADSDFVNLNSFHEYVRAGGVPPVFLIHGNADTVVPSNQSVLMCNAYGGNAQDHGGGAPRHLRLRSHQPAASFAAGRARPGRLPAARVGRRLRRGRRAQPPAAGRFPERGARLAAQPGRRSAEVIKVFISP